MPEKDNNKADIVIFAIFNFIASLLVLTLFDMGSENIDFTQNVICALFGTLCGTLTFALFDS